MAGWNKIFTAALVAEAASGAFGVSAGLKVDPDLVSAFQEEKALIRAAVNRVERSGRTWQKGYSHPDYVPT